MSVIPIAVYVYNRRDVHGPLQAHVYEQKESKSVVGTSSDSLLDQLFTRRNLL